MLLFYPLILLYQVATGTVPNALGRAAVLALLSVLAWAWMIRLYRNADFGGLQAKATE